MTIQQNNHFEFVRQNAQQAALLHSAADALEWDERTGMPIAAGEYRAEQVSTLRGLAHQKRTDAKYQDSIEQLFNLVDKENSTDISVITIKKLHGDLQRDTKLSTDLVKKLATLTVRGQQQWDSARKNNCFEEFKPILKEIVKLKREVGDRLKEGTDLSRYESLIDEYEPGARTQHLDKLFENLRIPLVDLIKRIGISNQKPNPNLFRQSLPIEKQRELSRMVAESIGFDFGRGRLDETSHPFCTTLGPHDCRILTRYDPSDLATGLFGTMHEAGHGMYEQGLDPDAFGLPLGSYCSLGIHESQSRMWENQVGRSEAFWTWIAPKLEAQFGPQLGSQPVSELYFAANEIRPSLIRVEADEATYNLHIIIRYDLEKMLIEGTLGVEDLSEAWNTRYHQDLGITVEEDRDGVLQDVHWSAGLFGYFPTYTLGNLIGAQLFASAETAIGDLHQNLANGRFDKLLEWSRDTVHRHGRTMNSEEIVKNATGDTLSPEYLINYLKNKLEPLYGI